MSVAATCTCSSPGDGTGPTIVLEAAMLGFSAQWAGCKPTLRPSTPSSRMTALVWDGPTLTRAVWIPTASPRTCTRPLHRRGLQEPWVLVGHSIGGLLVRTFADRYADEVAGVVLVDATHPEVVEGPMMPIGGHAIRLLGRIGVLRATGLLAREAAGLPADKLAEVMPILNSSRHIEGAAGEMAGLSQIGRDTSAAGDLGSAPLTVITAGDQPQEWHALQRDLATLSTSSRHIVVLDAAHQSLATDHRHARIVADEVAQLSRS